MAIKKNTNQIHINLTDAPTTSSSSQLKPVTTISGLDPDLLDRNPDMLAVDYAPEFIPYYWKIQQDYELSDLETKIYGFIRYFTANNDKYFYFNNKQLGSLFGKKYTQVSLSIGKLVDKQLIVGQYISKLSGGTIRKLRVGPTIGNLSDVRKTEHPDVRKTEHTTTGKPNVDINNKETELQNNISVDALSLSVENSSPTPDLGMDTVKEIHAHYCQAFSKNPKNYKLTPERISKIRTRLGEFSAVDIKTAIDHAATDGFYSGRENDRGWFATLDWIVANYEHTERLFNLIPKHGHQKTPGFQNGNEPKTGKYENFG